MPIILISKFEKVGTNHMNSEPPLEKAAEGVGRRVSKKWATEGDGDAAI